ncbi:LPXTG cell wall anchor domain-containing protein [Limosilactobacillus oris]|nr:LPXTG cell wall anchor domain-containing protein [Limosilactobacillus oris]
MPQTGDENSSALVGLGLMGITLGMFGLKKKEDN